MTSIEGDCMTSTEGAWHVMSTGVR